MPDLSLWVEKLETAQTDLKKVGLAADIPAAKKQLKQSPSAFILPGTERGGSNAFSNAVHQTVTVTVGVLTAVKNAGTTSGKRNIDQLNPVRIQIDDALLAWEPSDCTGMVEYVSGRLVAFDEQVLWHLDFYKTTYDKRKV